MLLAKRYENTYFLRTVKFSEKIRVSNNMYVLKLLTNYLCKNIGLGGRTFNTPNLSF